MIPSAIYLSFTFTLIRGNKLRHRTWDEKLKHNEKKLYEKNTIYSSRSRASK